MLKSVKYRIYPNNDQKDKLAQSFGCARFIYNNALAHKNDRYQNYSESLSYISLQNRLLALKQEFSFLKDVPSQSLQMSIRHLDSAYKNFFRRNKAGKSPGFPRFKNKFGKQSITLPQGVRLDTKSSRIFIPKIKLVTAVLHRKLPDNALIKTCTVSKTLTNKYFVSVTFDDGLEKPVKKLGKEIGIDLGVKDFVTFSDGTKIKGQKYFKKYLKVLQKVQKKLSSKKKGSNNRNKVKFRLAKIHEKITNSRTDYLHKVSKKIIDENQVIFFEDLNVKNMLEDSYTNLARNISDVSFGIFSNMLRYKADLYGKYVYEIPAYNTSKICSSCYEINEELTLSDRVWQCKHCQAEHDRDINAAHNVLRIGQGLPEYQKALKGSGLAAA